MRAAVFDGIGHPLRISDVAMPQPGPGEVLIEIERCGVCGSDLHMTEDPVFCVPSGAILGHEMAGRIIERGKGAERFAIGDRVSVLPISSCGTCASCLAGEPAWCAGMALHGGGFAQYFAVSERQCIALPSTLSAEDGALVEPLAVGLHGVVMAAMEKGARVLVVGAGPIGLATIYWARKMGAGRIAVTARTRQREDMALGMGADLFIDPQAADDPAQVSAIMGGLPDIVFECVGQPGLIDRCIKLVRPRGTVVVLGLCTKMDQIDPFFAISKEVRIQMAVFYGIADFENSARALDAGDLSPRAMITDSVGLSDLPEAFEALRQRTTQCKIMVMPQSMEKASAL
ncbi:zinc-binding dehydrogenase [Novosphingobium sp. AAP83]|uniref:zinc-dependent alcohol dehydrogenase n=1 Tax=Novosphingobium sp. AAP83 TaxID=1523425 RepID=UPI0009ECB654|nr:alcohol dehydrogenase catalytic domain-containing protein [Novosphingobium sp. AAP83]